jgi:hypothetical protein
MPHPHRIEEDGLPVLVVGLEQREVSHVREDRDDQRARPASEPEVRTQCEGGAEARGGVGRERHMPDEGCNQRSSSEVITHLREGHMPASGEEEGAISLNQSHSSRWCWSRMAFEYA